MINKVCPKCKSNSFTMTVYRKGGTIYEVEDGVLEANGMTDDGDSVSVTCQCAKCGYIWHPRNLVFEIDK